MPRESDLQREQRRFASTMRDLTMMQGVIRRALYYLDQDYSGEHESMSYNFSTAFDSMKDRARKTYLRRKTDILNQRLKESIKK